MSRGTYHSRNDIYLRLPGRVVTVRFLLGHLLEHLVEPHVYNGILLNQSLKLLDNEMKWLVRARRVLDMGNLLVEPAL